MGHYHKRPEKGGCDAMAKSYNGIRPCPHIARIEVEGKKLCVTHAKIVVLNAALKEGSAKRIKIPQLITGEISYINEEENTDGN